MLKKAAVFILLLIGVFGGAASAQEFTLFGPQSYERTAGPPNVFTAGFDGYMGTGTLIVSNGTQIDDDTLVDFILQARIYLNGVQIFGPRDFKRDAYRLEAPVDLARDNTLSIELGGRPGGHLSVEIIQDVLPPVVNFTANPTEIFKGEATNLSWQTVNADSCAIEPGIGAVNLDGSHIDSPTQTTVYLLTAENIAGSTSVAATVSILNRPPVSESQTVALNEDESIAIPLGASDPDEDPLTFEIVAAPLHGALSGDAPGLTYTPQPNYNGSDSFSFKAHDGQVESNTAVVSLSIYAVNDAPVAQIVAETQVYVGDPVALDGSGSQDVDGDPLNFTWALADMPEQSTAELSDSAAVAPMFTPDLAGGYTVALIVNDGQTDSPSVSVVVSASLPMVAVPDVADLLQADAEAAIIGAGLSVGTVSTAHSETVPVEHVISQVPAAGASVVQGSPVDLVVSLGPIAAPEDVDFGFAADEQQGGGGLVGATVRVLNGNALVRRSDISFPSAHRLGLSLQAAYNSRSSEAGDSGFGWTHTYEASCDADVVVGGETFLKIVDQTGRAHYFSEDTPGAYKGEYNERTHVTVESNEYVWYLLDGSRYGFSGDGQLKWIDDEKGNRLALTYDATNRLETVDDIASGRSLTFHYVDGLLDHVSGPATAAVPDGIWAAYDYDLNQNLSAVIYADGSGFSYAYDDADDIHNITAMRNQAGHLRNTWTYDDKDRCTDNFSADGRGATLTYASDTQVNVTDAYGAVRAYTLALINGRQRVTAMQGAAGAPYDRSNIVRWQYDSSMNLIEVETAGGAIHQYQDHDSRGNPQTVIMAAGAAEQRTITYAFHPDMSVPLTRSEASVLGAGSKVTIWDYDDDYDTTPNANPGRLISRLVEQGFTRNASGATVAYEYVTTFTYNTKGQVESIDGPLTGGTDTTFFAYEDVTGNLQSVTQPLIGATGFADYDAAGQPATVTDVNGQSDYFTYDGRGRITEIVHSADSSIRTVIYGTAGLPDLIVDEDGVYYSFEYDETYGRLVNKEDMDGNYILYAYDSQGSLIERSRYSASGDIYSHRRWDYQHPAIPGRLFREIKYDNSMSEYDYDADGNVSAVTDFNLNTTAYEYDALNRLVTVTQPESAVTSYAYDTQGNLVSVLDAENHETTFTYDDMGRAVAVNSPDSGMTTYAYDEAGNLVQKADANAIAVQYGYDALNRLLDVQFPDAAQDIGYSYDAGPNGKGRRTGMTDPSGSTAFAYDSRGRLTGKTTTVNAVQYEMLRAYTAAGRMASFVFPTGRTVDFDRYENGKIQTVSTTGSAATVDLFSNMTYDPFGRASGMDTGTGSSVTNKSGTCACLEKTNPGQMMEQAFAQDGNGNIIDITASNISSMSQSFAYDGLNRLVSASGSYGTIDFSYDKVGNRLSRTVGGQSDIYSYIAGTNRLEQIAGPNAAAYNYDASGNITAVDNRAFIYNQNNRLIRVEEGTEVLGEYTYNGLGQRVIKDADGEVTVFLYDFDGNIIAEGLADGTIASEYLYMGTNRIAMADTGTGNLYYYNNNYLGTPLLITDSDGNVVWDTQYKPFGEAEVSEHASVVNNFRFAGQYYDAETGLHYNWHRYYDPRSGRYLTPDPIGFLGGDINIYGYVLNNPTNKTDKYGLFIQTLPIAGVALYKAALVTIGTSGAVIGGGILADILSDVPYIPSEDEAEDFLFDILTNDFYRPDDPTDPKSWEEWAKERDKRIYDETTCETRTPWLGPGKGYDPEDPDNDPEAPLWKKIARVIMDLLRLGNP